MINISLTVDEHRYRIVETTCEKKDLFYILSNSTEKVIEGQTEKIRYNLTLQFFNYPSLLQTIEKRSFDLNYNQIDLVGEKKFDSFKPIQSSSSSLSSESYWWYENGYKSTIEIQSPKWFLNQCKINFYDNRYFQLFGGSSTYEISNQAESSSSSEIIENYVHIYNLKNKKNIYIHNLNCDNLSISGELSHCVIQKNKINCLYTEGINYLSINNNNQKFSVIKKTNQLKCFQNTVLQLKIDQLYDNDVLLHSNTVETIFITNTNLVQLTLNQSAFYIYILKNKFLKTLNFQNCDFTKQLYIDQCAIQSLDIQTENLPELLKLVVTNNKKSCNLKQDHLLPQSFVDVDTLKNINIDTNIQYLQLKNYDNNQLTISSNKLKYFDVSNNRLQEIYFYYQSYCLQHFDVKNNKLTTIKMGNKGKNVLNHITTLEYVNIDNNLFENIDFSYCGLTNFICKNNCNLKSVNLFKNKIQNCQFSNCDCLELVNISSQTQNGAYTLKSFVCVGSKLNNVNISENKNVEHIDVSHNELKKIDILSNKQIKYIDISNNNLEKLDFCGCISIKKLICSNNFDLTSILNLNIIQFLQSCNTKLTDLNLTFSSTLYYLNVDNNLIQKIDLTNTNCQTLYAKNNKLKFVQFGNLSNVNAYLQNNQIELLNSKNHNNIVANNVKQCYLFDQNLYQNYIDNVDHLSISYSLSDFKDIEAYNKNIKYLQLNNKNGNIIVNCSLIEQLNICQCTSPIVDLSYNRINCLKIKKSNINQLNLRGNNFRQIEIDILNNIQYIDLTDCEINTTKINGKTSFNKIIDQFIKAINFQSSQNGLLVLSSSKIYPYFKLTEEQLNKFTENNWSIVY